MRPQTRGWKERETDEDRGAEGGYQVRGTGGAAPKEKGMWPEGASGAKAESALQDC